MQPMKTCSKCGEEKALTEFRCDKQGAPLAKCKPCLTTYHAEWSAKNKDKVLANSARARSKPSHKEYHQRYYLEHRVLKPKPPKRNDGMRACSKCGENKRISEFGRHNQKADRLRTWCKPCNTEDTKRWYQANLEIARRKAREYGAAHPEEGKRRSRKWYAGNKDRSNAESRVWALANPERRKEVVKRSEIKHRATKNAYGKKYRQSNKDKTRANWAKRHAQKLSASPKWLTAIQKAQIQEFYDVAVALETQTGIKHHVDHIHPLQGANFRGLHVPWNLQVLTSLENISKGNRLIDSPLAYVSADA